MLTFSRAMKIYFSLQPADMRKSFDGLSAMVQMVLDADPLSGHLFVFINKRADRMKAIYWDGDGYAVWCKRLEQGTFRMPMLRRGKHDVRIEMTSAELSMLLEGIEVKNVRRRTRYSLPK